MVIISAKDVTLENIRDQPTSDSRLDGNSANNSFISLSASGKVLMERILSIGFFVGVANSVVVGLLPFLSPNIFTKSSEVVRLMQSVTLPLVLATLPHCLMLAFEGNIFNLWPACTDGRCSLYSTDTTSLIPS